MQFERVIFDWDGTLGMTLHLWLEGYKTGLANQGYAMSDNQIMQVIFHAPMESTKTFPDIDPAQMFRDTRDYVHDNLASIALYDGALETLEGLAEQGVEMALVTSSPRRLIDTALAPRRLDRYFASIIAGDEVSERKPDPEPFTATLANLGADPATTLIVGDSHVDITAGKAAGTQTCLFTPDENRLFHDFTALQAHGPDHTITALTHLAQRAERKLP